jgi:hypothetical protein
VIQFLLVGIFLRHLLVDANNEISLLPTRRINRLNVDQSNFFFIALMN